MKKLLIVALAALLLCACTAPASGPIVTVTALTTVTVLQTAEATPTPTPEASAAPYTVKEVFDAYEENEVRADVTFKGNRIVVTGTVDKIEKTLYGKAKIRLKYGDSLDNISCVFPSKEDFKKVAALNEGDTVTVAGLCDGKSLWEVFMINCTIQ